MPRRAIRSRIGSGSLQERRGNIDGRWLDRRQTDPKTGAACGLQSKLRLTRLALVWLF
jgi:hypothetical protein